MYYKNNLAIIRNIIANVYFVLSILTVQIHIKHFCLEMFTKIFISICIYLSQYLPVKFLSLSLSLCKSNKLINVTNINL